MRVNLTPAVSKNNFTKNNASAKQNPAFGQALPILLAEIKDSPGGAMNGPINRMLFIKGKEAYQDILDTIRVALKRKDIEIGPNGRKTYEKLATNLESALATGK